MNVSKNPVLFDVILTLKKASKGGKGKIYATAARYLERSKRSRAKVNVGKIEHITKAGSVVLVPGKVLGVGNLSHKVIVGAYSFSKTSAEKILKVGGKTLTLSQIVKEYPLGEYLNPLHSPRLRKTLPRMDRRECLY